MLAVLPLVLILTFLLLNRLTSGTTFDLTRIQTGTASRQETGTEDNRPAQISDEDRMESGKTGSGQNHSGDSLPENDAAAGRKRFTLTAAGTVVMEGDVRKNCYYEDVRVYDFSDIMSLLKSELNADVNLVFLENIITDAEKTSDLFAPSSLAAMLNSAGFNMAACGFAKAWAREGSGISDTRRHLTIQHITPAGICDPEDQDPVQIQEYGGIPVAVLQYTDTISSTNRKKMTRKGESRTVPAADPEEIRADIQEARNRGARAVIVLLNWGKIGGKQPDKAQRNLAQKIAEAGADLIIGSGSQYPQTAEYLSAEGRQVLCVYSLGTMLSGERKLDRLSGYLFHAELMLDDDGILHVNAPGYTPVYTWKSSLSGKLVFRCLAANRNIPDGMDEEQQKTMGRSAEATRKALQDSPLQER